jgi:uncharacterized protein (DUF58 family)
VTIIWRLIYRSYRLSSSIGYWARRRFTVAGWMVLLALALTALMGPDTENNVAYQAFALLLCLIVAAMVSSWFYRARFSAQRLTPRFGTVGSPIPYRIQVKNLSKKTQSGLSLLENLEDPRPSFPDWRAGKVAYDKRSRSFRVSGRPRRRSFEVAATRAVPTPMIPPGHETEVRLELTPHRRGVLRFEGLTVARSDPLGLFRGFCKVSLPEAVLILPRRYPLPPIEFPGTMRYQAGGIALASNVGQSDEFVSLRDYRHGDPIRHIHWRSWAKTGKPVVREFEDEFFVRHALVLDTFTDDPNSEIFEEAVSVAASFACSVRTQESLLDLLFVGAESYCFTTGRGLGRSEQMLEILASVKPCVEPRFARLHHTVIEHARLVSGCICIFLTWDEPRQKMVKRLRDLGVPLLIMVVAEPGRREPLDPGPMREQPGQFHVLEAGHIEAGLAKMR